MIHIPPSSQPALAHLNLLSYEAIQSRLDVFEQFDSEHPHGDPSNVKFLGRIDGGKVVAWSAKLAIDADGIGRVPDAPSGKDLDPDYGQNDTSFHIDGKALCSDMHPYYVLPGGLFRQQTGLQLGDLCAVIYNGCVTGAVFGDIGPWDKLGEGSIFLHEGLMAGGAPDPCHIRDPDDGHCEIIRNSSIPGDVIVIGFPGSAIDLKWETAADQIRQDAYSLLSSIRNPKEF